MNNINTVGKNCCGCTACEQVCPKKCITFLPDSEGFMYPVVDEKSCVECGVCLKHCPINTEVERGENPKVYAAKIKNDEALFLSTSGGVFYELAKLVLSMGGVVFGCAYDKNLVARHIAVETEDELYRLQNSKYVQSDLSNIYTQVRAALKSDRYVLFSGTGCQTAGLRAFLGRKYEKLLLVDIVCHGVPSPKLFEKYIKWLGKKMGGEIIYFNFRSKKGHGWQHFFQADTAEKSKTKYGLFDPYYNAFIKSKTIRESCYNCKFANVCRAGDITLGDYWGIEYAHPEFYSSKGVSLVFINSEKGEEWWSCISHLLDSVESDIERAVKLNGNLVRSPLRPQSRDCIYSGIDGNFDRFIGQNLSFTVNPLKWLSMMLPSDFKIALKKLKRKLKS